MRRDQAHRGGGAAGIAKAVGDNRFKAGRYEDAAGLFLELALADRFDEFPTLSAYDRVVAEEGRGRLGSVSMQ